MDDAQEIEGWELLALSLIDEQDCDVYVTRSARPCQLPTSHHAYLDVL